MSLLLDALKKAAKEKQSADNSNADDGTVDELDLDSADASDADQSENDFQETTSERSVTTDTSMSGTGAHRNDDQQADGISATPLTVSDEALQVLVHKANKQFKSSQTFVWGSVLLATFILLISGGVYFYYSMADDVAFIERKHRLVMRSVTDTQLSRSVTEKIERQKALKEAQQKIDEPVLETKDYRQPAVTAASQKANKNLVIKKTQKPDPVDVLATKAWNEYKAGEYETARSIYMQVLAREENNRDGLLGLAAIALKQDDIENARAIYGELLQLNPRDPIAVSALSNLEKVNYNELGESKLKLMIRQNNGSPHLYFALGNFYSQQSRWPEAQRSYFNAWQGDDKNADYAFNLAVSLDQMGKQTEAIKFYETSLVNAEPGNTQFSIEAAESRLQQLSDGLN